MKGFEAREIIDDDGNFCGYCDECSGSDPCLRCDRNELRDEVRRLRASDGKLRVAVEVEYNQGYADGAAESETLSSLRELVDDLGKIKPFRVADGYHETARQVDAWFKKFLKLAERTIPGRET